jgi:hypothetical protein
MKRTFVLRDCMQSKRLEKRCHNFHIHVFNIISHIVSATVKATGRVQFSFFYMF